MSWRRSASVPGHGMPPRLAGSGPDGTADVGRIACPVYGFYGGNDARVNATIPKSEELMKKAGKTYEPVTYEGAGHGFMRAGDAPDASPANVRMAPG